jgi:hypothetical protein
MMIDQSVIQPTVPTDPPTLLYDISPERILVFEPKDH